MNKFFSFKNNLIIYFSLLSIFTVFFLYIKHQALTDSSVSDWLINYQGGFTRRGLIGEFFFQIGIILNIHIRFVIFLFQSFFYLLFYFFLFFYLKDLKLNFLLLLAIFSPLFTFYPIAELESLGRKEILMLITFLSFCLFQNNKSKNIIYIYFLFILPILVLIWEGVIFFYLFFLAIYMFSLKKSNYLIFLLNCFYLTLPTLFILILITLFKHSQTEYKLMCASLEFFYNQKCYMALTYTPRNLVTNMGEVKSLFSIVNLFRFIFIFILGFLPLFLLTYASSLRSSKIYTFFFNKVSFIYLILIFLLPTFFIYLFAIDWGRWIHISYSMSIIFFVYCLKNKIIYSNKNSSKKLNFFGIKNNFILIIVFILFALSWNHKTVMHEDIGSIPIYRALSKIYKWRNMEIFTSIDISRASKIYISSGPFFENK